jgi:hypothetical protein
VERPLISRSPIRPDRLRRINGQSFAFLPHRLLRDGFLSSLAPDEQRLYLFLVLAADRNGISFYSCDRVCSTLEMVLDDYIDARNGLLDKDLIAFDGVRFQVLSLPETPVYHSSPDLRTRAQLEDHDPATVRQTILASFPWPGQGPRTSR